VRAVSGAREIELPILMTWKDACSGSIQAPRWHPVRDR